MANGDKEDKTEINLDPAMEKMLGLPDEELDVVRPDHDVDPSKKKTDDIGDPNEEHPRFKKIYGDLKAAERSIATQTDQIDALTDHNKQLAESIYKIEDSTGDANRPDPVESPNEFADFIYEKAKRDIERKRRADQEKEHKSDSKNTELIVDPRTTLMNEQATVLRTVHDDYSEIMAITDADMNNDPVLRAKIFSSENAPLAGYKHGLARKEVSNKNRKDNIDQGYVEGGSPSPSDKNVAATPEQVNIARKLGMTIKDYMDQDAYIRKNHRRTS